MKLFEPIRIGSMQLANRLVMSPMTTGYAGEEQLPGERLLRYIEARAAGGVGLITLEACVIDREHLEVPHSMHFDDDSVIEHHRRLVEMVHSHGAKVQPQIVHPGPDSLSPLFGGGDALGPSVIPSYLTGHPSRELSKEDLPRILDQYASAVRRVRAAGYDGIELHAAHGYMLIGSFLSPWRNKRGDEYAGRKREGRLRFLLEVLAAIRAEVGADFPITLRVSGYERVPAGRSIDDTAAIAPRLVEAGVDAFHVSGGVIDRLTSQIVTGPAFGDGHNVAVAAAVKNVVDVPVMVVGRIHDPRLGERILERKQADMIVIGRPLLADPELPNKTRRGELSTIRSCISCQSCIDSMERGQMGCAVNGLTGREVELSTGRAARSKKVVVIGGGPGGMEAARVARLRGHEVTLYERQGHLGGALMLAATVHPENQAFLGYLTGQMKQLAVDVRLGERVTDDTLRSTGADAVIVATGGRIVTPRIPGDEQRHVLRAAQLKLLLAGRLTPEEAASLRGWQRAASRLVGPAVSRLVTPRILRAMARAMRPLGRRVMIVGADLAAIELAEMFAQVGRTVTIVERQGKLAPEIGLKRRTEHMDRLDRLGVAVNTGVEYVAITRDGMTIAPASGNERLIEADTVVIAGELEPDTALFDAASRIVPESYTVGDCTGLGLIVKATREATEVACAL